MLLLAAMSAAVHFNTIIHPFALADNRHYVFYVFKLLRNQPWLKYVAIPLYLISGWLVLAPLAAGSQRPGVTKVDEKASGKDTEAAVQPIRASFLIVFLASTALSLVTAPLVEPRYFLVPWVVWRLHVDVPPVSDMSLLERCLGRHATRLRFMQKRKFLLSVETTWHLLVSLLTGYAFLHRGYEWASEPGQVQRFLW